MKMLLQLFNRRIGRFGCLLVVFIMAQSTASFAYSPGDIVRFGNYTYGDDGSKSPIEWIILHKNKDNTALLISKQGLALRPYNEDGVIVPWERSSIRKWLNSTFYSEAFSPEEKKAVKNQKLLNSSGPSSHFSSSGKAKCGLSVCGNDTNDNVYLLSSFELAKYASLNADISIKYSSSNEETSSRKKTEGLDIAFVPSLTPYIQKELSSMGIKANGSSFYWLRFAGSVAATASNGITRMAAVNSGGNYYRYNIKADDDYVAIRPAITVDLSALDRNGSDSDYSAESFEFPNAAFKNPNGIAVIIGVKNYENNVPAVEYALNDAQAVREFVIKTLGYTEDNIIYVEDPTKGKMEEIFGTKDDHKAMLYDFVKPGKSDVFVYYAGHGAPDQSDRSAYFVPKEANPDYIKHSGYSMAALYGNLSKLPARKITVVTDACFSGQTGDGKMIIKGASPLAIGAKIPVPTAGKSGKSNLTVFNASRDTEMASWYAEKQHGLFTYYFLYGLTGEADSNQDGTITAGEMDAYLQENVPYRAKRMYHRKQTPVLIGDDKAAIAVYK